MSVSNVPAHPDGREGRLRHELWDDRCLVARRHVVHDVHVDD